MNLLRSIDLGLLGWLKPLKRWDCLSQQPERIESVLISGHEDWQAWLSKVKQGFEPLKGKVACLPGMLSLPNARLFGLEKPLEWLKAISPSEHWGRHFVDDSLFAEYVEHR